MLRRFVHILMLLAFVIQTEGALLTWLAYVVNSNNIATLYCQNPTNPRCHGKCHITKVTVQEEEKGAKQPRVRILLPEQLPCLITESTVIPAPTTSVIRFTTSFPSPLCSGLPQDIDHPPPIG